MVLRREKHLMSQEFMCVYRVQKNPKSQGVYNFQTKCRKFVQMEVKFSSNRFWKNKFFFATRKWEFAPLEPIQGPRGPREMSLKSPDTNKEPLLSKKEVERVNRILMWA